MYIYIYIKGKGLEKSEGLEKGEELENKGVIIKLINIKSKYNEVRRNIPANGWSTFILKAIVKSDNIKLRLSTY